MRVLERPSDDELVLELNHVDVSFVNALRRILLSEIPTVAIEMVYMWNNTSLIHDEVLAHRLGLIPIHVDPRRVQDFYAPASEDADEDEEAGNPTDRNTIVFRLQVKCTKQDAVEAAKKQKKATAQQQQQQQKMSQKKTTKKGADDDDDDSEDDLVVPKSQNPELENAAKMASKPKPNAKPSSSSTTATIPQRPYTKHVYSGDLVWLPQGDQKQRWKNANIRPVYDDILIAKLRPGQEIDLECHARKGTGKDHAKYSPVATASYRLYTEIELLHPIYDDLAEELVHVYEPGVFELVPTNPSKGDPAGSRVKAKVCNTYACTMSRNYMRNPELAKAIRMVRIPDRFIFSIESVGMHSPAVLLAEALKVLQAKCRRVQDLADQTILLQES